ncbi:MAG: hypothetical protein BGN86_01940 [Caulobacterales bacterium 68-7]|nr:MAG: hypothetical protein BGN86_01940 [Caulobacterales bacterium 68-7]
MERGVQPAEVKSPEVLPDGRVTFRIGAKDAKSVTLGSEFVTQGNAVPIAASDMTAGPPPVVNFTRGADGVWTGTTTTPIRPGVYRYYFVVDGVVTLDPRNIQMSPQRDMQNSLLVVKGDFSEHRQVPHGAVSTQYFTSSTLGGVERKLIVYTPPGYERGQGSYPVLYLMHGGGDNESSWVTAASVNDIMDNLLAEGKAKPFIIVMPAGYTPDHLQIMTPDPSKEPFVKELTTDVIPFVEKTYRTLPNADNRAMAGLSMGGIQTLNAGVSNLDKFHSIGVFSSGYFYKRDRDWYYENRAPKEIPQMKDLKVFYWAWGATDFARDGSVDMTNYLKSKGVKLTTLESPGGHDWRNWRLYFHEFAPMLFR